jgi:SAM-dependent methyltransferase
MGEQVDRSGPIRSGWNRAAVTYREGLGIQLEPVAKHLSGLLALHSMPPVLDLACGPGTVLTLLCGKGDILGVGCDFSMEMVRIARARIGGALGVVADQDRLPFADASFQTVASSMGTIFSSDPEAQIPEIARILKPGGSYGFSAWGRPEECALRAVSEVVIREWPYPYEGEIPKLESPYSPGPTEWLEAVSARAGFGIDRVEPGELVFRFPDRDAAARAILGTGRFALLLEGAPGRERELFDRARTAFSPHADRTTGQVELSNRYHVFLLRKG